MCTEHLTHSDLVKGANEINHIPLFSAFFDYSVMIYKY